jgi:hypothetical protein
MTQEQQRVAIAEACGEDSDSIVRELIPDYLNDLNAMHDAENSLTTSQMTTMSQYLHRKIGVLWGFATASQRAEAFLRTIGKWKEAKP